MEHTNKKMTRQEKIQIGIIITTFVVICVMIIAIITLVKYAEEIRNNPVDYAIEHTNIKSCTCYNGEGLQAFFGQKSGIDNTFVLQSANG